MGVELVISTQDALSVAPVTNQGRFNKIKMDKTLENEK